MKKLTFNKCKKYARSQGLILSRITPMPYVSLLTQPRYLLESTDGEFLGSFFKLKEVKTYIDRYYHDHNLRQK